MTLGVGQLVPSGAVNGLILADVDVVAILGNVEVTAIGDVGEALVGGRGDDLHLTVLLCLGDGLLGPHARLHIAGLAVLHQVDGHHGELHRTAALNEQHLIVIGDTHQLAQVSLGLLGDLHKSLVAVAHLHHGHAGAAIVHHLIADLLQHGLGHHSGACRKVKRTIVLHKNFPPKMISVVVFFVPFALVLPIVYGKLLQ